MLAAARPAGACDFDFLFGSWQIANRRLVSRLTGSNTWEEFPALLTCHPVLDGLGNIDELRPTRPGWEGFVGGALRLFNPATRLWSIHWFENVGGSLGTPLVGQFTAGVGEFFGDDLHEGQPVRVRFRWAAQGTDNATWEQAFSIDNGTIWETNWTQILHRSTASDSQHQ